MESKLCYKRASLQNRNRFSDLENKPMVTKGDEGWERGKLGVISTYRLLCVCLNVYVCIHHGITWLDTRN